MTRALIVSTLLLLAACKDDGDLSDDSIGGDSGGGSDSAPDSSPDSDDTAAPEDADQDGYPAAEDCDDSNPSVNPGAAEICDSLDNNCDGQVDEGVASTWYTDGDGDGWGSGDGVLACTAPEGTSASSGDCDDADPRYNPAAEESDCSDPNDYNCDGSVGYADGDGDGYPACEDCDDGSTAANPGATEVCDDVDNNCDGAIDEGLRSTYYVDADGDGFGDADYSAEACAQPSGYSADSTDCDDALAAVNPAATEVCNGYDDDCDAQVDDADPGLDAASAGTWYTDADGDGYGDAGGAVLSCSAPSGAVADSTDCDDTDPAVSPGAAEVCDDADNNCDGAIDDADAALDTSTASTWYADTDADGYGDPANKTLACDRPSGYRANLKDCDDGDAAISPVATEVCDGVDNDCDSLIDDDDPGLSASAWYSDSDGDGYGDSSASTVSCTQPSGTVADDTDCDDTDSAISPGATEACDGLDGDCDGDLPRLESDPDGDGALACEESLWLSTDGNYFNNPAGGGSEAAALLSARGVGYTSTRHNATTLTDAVLDDYGVLVIYGNGNDGTFTTAEAAALEQWVEDGGGLLIIAYHPTTAGCAQVNSLPTAFGLSCTGTSGWSGTTSTFVSHPVTSGLSTIGGLGGEDWAVASPMTALATVSSKPILVVAELGEGKVAGVADEWPYYNSSYGSSSISYGSNALMVDNIWAWLLE